MITRFPLRKNMTEFSNIFLDWQTIFQMRRLVSKTWLDHHLNEEDKK